MFSTPIIIFLALLMFTIAFSIFILIDANGKDKALALIPIAFIAVGVLVGALLIQFPFSQPPLTIDSFEWPSVVVTSLSTVAGLILLFVLNSKNKNLSVDDEYGRMDKEDKENLTENLVSSKKETIASIEKTDVVSDLDNLKLDVTNTQADDIIKNEKSKEIKMPLSQEKDGDSDMLANIQKATSSAVNELLNKEIHEAALEAANNSAKLEIEKVKKETEKKIILVDEELQMKLSDIESALAELIRKSQIEKEEAIAQSKQSIEYIKDSQAKKEELIIATKEEVLVKAENAIYEKGILFKPEKVEPEVKKQPKKIIEFKNKPNKQEAESVESPKKQTDDQDRFKGLQI